jgi:hypothetical protein
MRPPNMKGGKREGTGGERVRSVKIYFIKGKENYGFETDDCK